MNQISNTLKNKADQLRELDPKHMKGGDIGSSKALIHHIFEPLLPYKAKNGVYFSSNGVSLCTNLGIVFGDNGYYGKDDYYLMLRHIPSSSTGESKYEASCNVDSFTTEALEKLSKQIQHKAECIAKEMLAKFT